MLNLIINIIIYNSITVPKCFNFVVLEEDLFAVLIMIFNHVVKTLLNSHCSLMYDELIKSSNFFCIILESSNVDNDVSYYCLCYTLFLSSYWWRISVGRLSVALKLTLMILSNLSLICTWSNLLGVYYMYNGINLIILITW
jgi:hypothetical protein